MLLFAVAALVILNLLKSGLFGETQAFPLILQRLYPLPYLFASLSLLAFAVMLLVSRGRRAAFRASAALAALSALGSAAYAIAWWVLAPELMFWQDDCGIALQMVACVFTAVVSVRKTKSVWLLLLSCAGIAGSTLLFLLPPLFEPAASVLTRALALASPVALLALGGLFTEDSAEGSPEE